MVYEILSKKMENILKSQISLIDKIYAVQKKVYADVLHRDWESTREQMNILDEISCQFSEEDKRLAMLIREINQTCSDQSSANETNLTVEQAIKVFSQKSQVLLLHLYKTLREKVFLSKIENDVFNNYIDHARGLVNGVFDVVSHNRSGQTYTRTGVKAEADISNLVVNRVF